MIWTQDVPTGTLASENPNPDCPECEGAGKEPQPYEMAKTLKMHEYPPCPRCGGAGYLLSGYGAGAPSLLDLEMAPECPDCDGTGEHCPPEPETPEEARALDLADLADEWIDSLDTIF